MRIKQIYQQQMMLLVSMIVILMSSCASTTYLDNGALYKTRVNEFGDRIVKGKSFYIESGDELVSSNDLEFKEYAGYVAENLKLAGAIETTDKENADICVLMNYCITDESYQETIPVPEFGRTSIASATTKGNKTTFQYNYGTTGYHYEQNNVSNFVRVVNVYAYDNKSRDNEPIMLWKTNFKSSGSSDDLRKVIPYMIYVNFFGMASPDDLNLRWIWENDHMFKLWKQKRLSSPNCYLISSDFDYLVQSGNAFDGRPFYIEKNSDETVICICKSGCYSYSISPELFIVCNGKLTKVSLAEDYELGSNIQKECGVRYFVLHFPINTIGENSFEIREYTTIFHKKYNTWGTVKFKR